jgi:polysaccharide biosynthesis protein PslJ
MTNGQARTAVLDITHPNDMGSPELGTGAIPLLTTYVILLTFIPSALVLGPLGGAGSPATLFALALLGWYALLWVHPRFGLYRGRQPARITAAFFASILIAAYVSANRHSLNVTAQNGTDRELICLAGWMAVLLLAADGIEGWERLRVLIRRIITCVSVISAIGITQFLTGFNLASYVVIPGLSRQVAFDDLLSRGGLNRPSATTAQPLELAAVLALTLPLALHQARFAGPGARFRCWLQAALIAGALPLTVSRSAVLGLAVIVVMLVPTWPKRERWLAFPVIGGGVVALWVITPSLFPLLYQLFAETGGESSSTSRVDAYSSSVSFIAAHPWLGQGFGTFLPQTYFFVDNQYLTSLIETGVLGLLAVVTLFGVGWWLARSARRACDDERIRDLLQCLAVSVVSVALSFFTFDAFSFATFSGLTFLLLGCIAAAWRLTRTRAPDVTANREIRLGPWRPRRRRPASPGTVAGQ